MELLQQQATQKNGQKNAHLRAELLPHERNDSFAFFPSKLIPKSLD